MSNNIDRYMSRLNDRLMSSAQQALNDIGYTLDEMEQIAAEHPEREDIRACIDDIKSGNKAKASEAWAIANRWSEHFDGISGGEDTDCDDKDEPTEEADNDEEDETTDDAVEE